MTWHAQTFWTGLVVAIVGFFSSFPIFLQGVTTMGANPDQAASALMAGAISRGLAGIVLALWQKMPISVAWSTPGVALLAVSAPDPAGFSAAIGAFVLAGGLTVLAGFWPALARLAKSIPAPITQAMLAGVLLAICLEPFRVLATAPQVALPILGVWFITSRFSRLFAVPAAVLMTLALIVLDNNGLTAPPQVLTAPVLTLPSFSFSALIGLGVPLFLVTMATQNVPGISVLRANGYEPPAGPMFASVGVFSLLSAPFGAAQTCLAAITAAMCSDETVHPDPAQRYMAAVWAGLFYCIFGLFAALVTHVAGLAPEGSVATLAGLALFSVFNGSATAALKDEETREASVLTFLITASGVTILGLGGAVWGLVLGCFVTWLQRRLK
ncbi:MAG: benzoate/H(+) symporter BenE family transporter [Pelagimonas sp.]|jgi:benzoate membrane transport protein|nr:benzoate/H(+) symporter BenE family transporter [Pelagimonas sp.]